MIAIVWEFQVAPAREREFEALYDSEGVWAVLFRNDGAYGGTTLLRDSEHEGRYLTVDRWDSLESYHGFKQKFAAEYAAIDKRCEALTKHEKLIGVFEKV